MTAETSMHERVISPENRIELSPALTAAVDVLPAEDQEPAARGLKQILAAAGPLGLSSDLLSNLDVTSLSQFEGATQFYDWAPWIAAGIVAFVYGYLAKSKYMAIGFGVLTFILTTALTKGAPWLINDFNGAIQDIQSMASQATAVVNQAKSVLP